MSSDALINWDIAARAAKRVVRGGPEVSLDEAKDAVAQLRECAIQADEHVSRITKIAQPPHTSPTLVIDRPGWIDVNSESVGHLMGPLVEKLASTNTTSAAGRLVGSRVTGAEAGVVLGFLASRVLGQYDIFGPRGGQLLLVAPNIIEAERKLDVNPTDFRLWVCLHEVTHRLQFTAVDWLGQYLRTQIAELVDATDLDSDSLKQKVKEIAAEFKKRAKSSADDSGRGMGIISLAQTPQQREIIERMTAVMSLLEGHAEYVMDEVGPSVVPSVAEIRRKFKRRRAGRSPVDRILRKVLGLEAKMRQYAEGRKFIDGVVAEVGMDGFNVVWSSPDNLPTMPELKEPSLWVQRVHPLGSTPNVS